MLFNSAEFLFAFLPLALIGYFALARVGHYWSRGWLCLASLVFYTWWEPAFLAVLLASIAFNFAISLLIGRATGKGRTFWLSVGVVGDLAALAYYKYAFWLVTLVSGHVVAADVLGSIALPLGISFFTFTQIGYLIDVKEEVAKERGFLNYLLFVTFFPHLIAGPILHHREVMPQFADRLIDRFNLRHFTVGMTVFLLGLFKKTVIADGVQPMVAAGYAQGGEIGTLPALLTILAYLCQLYFDFSGYSDMAVGLARMFNVKFPINFDSPHKARNIADFWQRWHMTLTRYLNAYLYNPVAVPVTRYVLGKMPEVKNPQATLFGFLLIVAFPTFWTMTLAGIWHGAGAQYVIFGLLHSAYIVTYRGWATWGPKPPKRKKGEPEPLRSKLMGVPAVLLTTVCVAIAETFFRAPTVDAALTMLRAAVGMGHAANAGAFVGTGAIGTAPVEIAVIALLFVIIWACPNVYQIMGPDSPVLAKMKKDPPTWLRWQPTLPWAVATGVIGAVAIVAIGHAAEFLYFQF